jgi:class 3 adenylate cyclase
MSTSSPPPPSLAAAAGGLGKHGVTPTLAGRLARYLEAAPPREVSHVNPRLLAERLDLQGSAGGDRAVLKLVVAALYEGLVILHWDVRCPACGNIAGHAGLKDLHHNFTCAMCQGQFAPQLDNDVRVTVSVHPRFRPAPPAPSADDLAFRTAVDERLGPVPGQALLLLPDFQRLFPQERLLPDESLEVARVALVFTDLAGSTALYAQRGDPRAYHLVRLHFEELFAVAERQGGTVVKNIGDAVMAAFQTPAAALAAALEMQAAIAGLNRRERLSPAERLILKVGLHSGPCLNVTLNDRPDYFGTTVNVAGLSRGGDVVFTTAIRDDPDVLPLLATRPLEASRAGLKGLDGALVVYRLLVLRQAAG